MTVSIQKVDLSHDEILDKFSDGACLIVAQTPKMLSLGRGCAVHIGGRSAFVTDIEYGQKERMAVYVRYGEGN